MSLYDRLAATPEGARGLAVARARREALKALARAVNAAGGYTELGEASGVPAKRIIDAMGGNGNIKVGRLARMLHGGGFELEIRLVPAGQPRADVLARRAEIEQLRGERDAAIEARDSWREEADAMVAETEWGKPGVGWAIGNRLDHRVTPMPPGIGDEAVLRQTIHDSPQREQLALLRCEHSAWHEVDAKDDDD